jgi:hypothetical protein
MEARIPMNWKAPLLAAALTLAWSVDAMAAHHGKGPVVAYPMKAGEFRKLSEDRLARILAVIDKKLDRGNVSAERRNAIHAMFDDAAKETRAEIAKAVADGSVTEAEAEKVKALAVQVRAGVRERMAAERKGKKPGGGDASSAKHKAPAKDAKPAKDSKPAKESKPDDDSKGGRDAKAAKAGKQA